MRFNPYVIAMITVMIVALVGFYSDCIAFSTGIVIMSIIIGTLFIGYEVERLITEIKDWRKQG